MKQNSNSTLPSTLTPRVSALCRPAVALLLGWFMLAGLACSSRSSCAECGGGEGEGEAEDSFPEREEGRYPLGYFIGMDLGDDALARLADFRRVVVDATFLEADQVAEIRDHGTEVYSYLNPGSLENWRDYYSRFADLCRGTYEGWEDECWVDVSAEAWQSFVVEELAGDVYGKGVDGVYLDNFDVYDELGAEQTREGLAAILKGLADRYPEGRTIVQNGLSFLFDEQAEASLEHVWGESREDVQFMPDFEAEDEGEHTYLALDETTVAETVADLEDLQGQGLRIFTIDYTEDGDQMRQAAELAREHGFTAFVGRKELADFFWYPSLER